MEENIAILQARIHELENPSNTSPPILLHDPYRAAPPREQSAGLQNTQVPTNTAFSTISATSMPAAMAWWEFEELPAPISDMLCVLNPDLPDLWYCSDV